MRVQSPSDRAELAVTDGRGPAEASAKVRRIRSRELFAGCPRVVIEHEGAEYRLQITRMGKLILTK